MAALLRQSKIDTENLRNTDGQPLRGFPATRESPRRRKCNRCDRDGSVFDPFADLFKTRRQVRVRYHKPWLFRAVPKEIVEV